MMVRQRSSEDDLIARHFAPLAGPGGLGLRDDAACLRPPVGCEMVLTVDAVVAGVHFFPDDPPEAIAWKALAVNLSDLAAKGAQPEGFLLALALPPDWTEDWLAVFARGLGEAAGQGGCPLLGGDTVKTPGPLTLSITALGSVPAGGMVRRTAAEPGDLLYVSGSIGDAALGLRLRQDPALAAGLPQDARSELEDRFLRPRPRGALAAAMRAHARAGMDVSDGLAGDLAKMMAASGAGARADLDAVPLSPSARALLARRPDLADAVVTGGDDYELLAGVPPGQAASFEAAALAAGVPVSRIGEVRPAGDGVVFLRRGKAVAFSAGSYSHF